MFDVQIVSPCCLKSLSYKNKDLTVGELANSKGIKDRDILTHQLHPAFLRLGTFANTVNAGSKPEPLGTSG